MKKLFVLLTILLAATAAPALASPTIGDPAPDFKVTGASGKTVSLSDYKGKIVVLEWTSDECPFVHKWYDSGEMQKLQKKAKEDGVVWLSVDSSSPSNPGYLDAAGAAGWLKKTQSDPADFLIDEKGEVGHLYDAKTTPNMFVIDKEGKLAYAGAIDSIATPDAKDIPKATNYVEDAIEALKAGKTVAVATTRSYGCGVKY